MKKIIIMSFLAFILTISVVNAYDYTIPYYVTQIYNSPIDIYGISFFSENECTIDMRTYSNLTGSGYDIALTWYSPNNTTKATGTLSGQNNHLCKYIGQANESVSLLDYYEGRNQLVHTATGGEVTLTNKFVCEESTYFFEIYAEPQKNNDTYSNVPFRFGQSVNPGNLANATVLSNGNYTNYDECHSELDTSPFLSQIGSGSASGNYDRALVTYYPFNSSSGTIHYRFDLGNNNLESVFCSETCVGTDFTSTATLFLLNVRSGTYSQLHHVGINCDVASRITGNWTGTLEGLEEDSEYMFIYVSNYYDDGTKFPCTRNWELREPIFFNISVFVYDPTWSCGEWSNCDGVTQTRTCIDVNGISPDRVEYSSCSPLILENATLGFEEYVTYSDIVKCSPSLFCNFAPDNTNFATGYNISHINVDRPLNWTIVDPSYGKANFLKMTQEWKTQGSRSLKMWTIPPKEHDAIVDSVSGLICGNLTTSIIPQTYQNISNDSFSVSYNVTFPSEFMQLGFSVKKCISNEVQNYNLGGLVWSNISGVETYLIPPSCYKRCYGECETEPNGRYYFNIIDTENDQSIFGGSIFNDAEIKTTSPLYILNGLGIEAGKVYRLVFAVVNENPHDSTGNCVYFDNIYYQTTDSDILLEGCESRCEGLTRYEAHQTPTGSCYLEIIEKSEKCATTQELQDALQNNSDFCDLDDSNILQRFDLDVGEYYEVECEYGCENGFCLTEEDVEETETETESYETEFSYSSLINEVVGMMRTRFFWASFFTSLAIIIGAGLGSKKGGKSAGVLGMSLGLIVAIFFTVNLWYPFWVGVGISLLIAMLMVLFLREAFLGK